MSLVCYATSFARIGNTRHLHRPRAIPRRLKNFEEHIPITAHNNRAAWDPSVNTSKHESAHAPPTKRPSEIPGGGQVHEVIEEV
eukprot:3177979-Pyramimonas_sp.AAC.2